MRTFRSVAFIASIFAVLVAAPVGFSAPLRSAYVNTVLRKIAWLWPQEHVFIGDSLTRDCFGRGALGRPFSTTNLARGGMAISDIAHQIALARQLGAKHLYIAAGINDVLLLRAPIEEIARNFQRLLDIVGHDQTVTVTLIPDVASASKNAEIRAANAAIAALTRAKGFTLIDLNPLLANTDGARKQEMTTDGVHLTTEACVVWINAIIEARRCPNKAARPGEGAAGPKAACRA